MRYLFAMRYLILLIFLPPICLGILGLVGTSRKLERMKQIRGWEPGATVVPKVIRAKWEDPQSGACWITITDESIHKGGPHRLNLPPEMWDEYAEGDTIEIVYLPDDPTPYQRDGIYASDGNFAFDRGLLVVEGSMIGVSVLGAFVTAVALFLLGLWLRRRQKPPGQDEPLDVLRV
jgi:hypothetical protein